MASILVIDKNPSRTNYSKELGMQVDVAYLCDEKVQRVTKSNMTIDTSVIYNYDHVILCGSDALKVFSRATGINDVTGRAVPAKEINGKKHESMFAIVSFGQKYFKPEIVPVLEQSVESITKQILNGKTEAKAINIAPVTSEEEALEYLKTYCRPSKLLGLDSETSALYARDGYILGLCVSHHPDWGRYISAEAVTDSVLEELQSLIDDSEGVGREVVLHNIKFDDKFFTYHYNISLQKAYMERRVHDTMVQHYVLDERTGTHGLKQLAIKFTDLGDYDFELDEFKKSYCKSHGIKQEDFSYQYIPFDIMWPYAACLHKDSKVYMADGTTKTIHEIVTKKIKEKVLSYDFETKSIVSSNIIDWVKNPNPKKEWFKLQTRLNQRVKKTITGPAFTPDHKIPTQFGYKRVDEIVVGEDKILSRERALSDDGFQVFWGSMLGDGYLESRHGKGAALMLQQASKRKEYLLSKLKAIGEDSPSLITKRRRDTGDTVEYYTSKYTLEYSDFYHNIERRDTGGNSKVKISKEILGKLDERALAIWYFDDGNLPKNSKPRIWSRTISEEEIFLVLDWMDSLGIQAKFYRSVDNSFFVIENEEFFFNKIFKFATPDVEYKIRGEIIDKHKYSWDGTRTEPYYADIIAVEKWEVPESRRGYSTSYCITVENTHNFLTDVGFVHNCDPLATLRLHLKFLPIIRKNDKLNRLYENILMPATNFLTKMEDRGVPVSKERLEKCKVFLYEKKRKLEEELYSLPEVAKFEAREGKVLNPNSPVQLRTFLFDICGITPLDKFTDTGQLSTDAEVLEKLGEKHKVAKLLLEIRKTLKILNTYIIKMIDNVDKDGRLRTGFSLHTTTSGRLSSSGKLNLQQLPRDDAMVKGCIVAPAGYRIIAKDLITAEAWVAAALSKDKNLMAVFQETAQGNGADLHSTIAKMVFNLSCEASEVKKKFPAMRQAAKAITFGILFGSGPDKVAESVNEALFEQHVKDGTPYNPIGKAEAVEYIETYFRRFSRLKKWIKESHNQILQHGYIYSHYGRKRRLRNINSSDRSVVGEELRSGL